MRKNEIRTGLPPVRIKSFKALQGFCQLLQILGQFVTSYFLVCMIFLRHLGLCTENFHDLI